MRNLIGRINCFMKPAKKAGALLFKGGLRLGKCCGIIKEKGVLR